MNLRNAIGCALSCLLSVLLPAVAPAQSNPNPPRVLLIFGHDPNAAGPAAFAQSFYAEVRQRGPTGVEFYNELLDYDRFGSARWVQQAAYIADKYKAVGLRLIAVEGSNALEFAVKYLSPLLPGLPIVYGLAFEPTVNFDSLPAHVTGRRQPLPFAETFRVARTIQPNAERVVIVGGAAAMDSLLLRAAVREITPLLDGMQLVVLQNWTYRSLLLTVRRLPHKTMVILSSFRQDTGGAAFNSGDLIPSLTRAASVPVYGIARNWVGDGVVAGATMNFADDGKHTGELAALVLERGPGAPLPARQVAGTSTVADWRQLQRWGLSEKNLPVETEVLFRPLTAWQRYRQTILITLAVLAAQSILIFLLLLERRKRIGAQRAVADQAAFEQMMAGLTTDAVRHAPIDEPHALEDALARLAQYAGANSVVLTVLAEMPEHAPLLLRWPKQDERPSVPDAERLAIELRAEGRKFGALELYRPRGMRWSAQLSSRVEAAADLLADALARARAASALEASRTQLAHMARVATVGELTATISHELRQPLTAIRAHAEAGALILGQRDPDVSEARLIFHDIVKDDLRAAAVIDHLRMLLRRETPPSAPVDVNGVCRLAAQLLQREATARGAHLRPQLAPGVPRINGDAVQLQQVVLNLVLNAMDATTLMPGARVVEIGTLAHDDTVEIFVRDTGPGIPSEILPNLFDPFYTTKPSGLGMGLAIVRAIVEGHQGTVRGENGVDGGAIFRVVLPAAHVAPAALAL